MQIELRITKKVPQEYKTLYPACCLADGKFYFGWKDKSATIFPVGQAVQRGLILFDARSCTSIKLVIEKEFSDTSREEVLIINKP